MLKKILFLLSICTLSFIFINNKSVEKNKIVSSSGVLKKRKISSIKPYNLQKFVGTLAKCRGTFYINNVKKMCKKGFKFKEFDSIRTSSRSWLRIKMIDETSLSIGPKSKVTLEKYKVKTKHNKNITINLIKGFIHTNFKKKVKKGKIFVKTRTAAMGVRGTEFFTEDLDGKVKLTLLHGLVEVVGLNKTQMIYPNDQIEIESVDDYSINKMEVEWVNDAIETFSDDSPIQAIKNLNIVKKYSNKVESKETNSIILDNKSSSNSQDKSSILDNSSNKDSSSNINNKQNNLTNKNVSIDKAKDRYVENEIKKSEILDDIKNVKEIRKDNPKKALLREKAIDQKINTFLNKNLQEDGQLKVYLDNTETSNDFKQKLIEYTERKLSEQDKLLLRAYKEGKVFPLIKPNDEVVYFNKNEYLLKNIPRDENGKIVGIRVDEDLNPIREQYIYTDEIVDQNLDYSREIPIVNEYGEIDFISVFNDENNAIINVPTDEKNNPIGIDKDNYNNESSGIVEEKNPNDSIKDESLNSIDNHDPNGGFSNIDKI